MKILVAGAGGMIGGHLVKALLDEGHEVKAVDIKPAIKWWQVHEDAENHSHIDLSNKLQAHHATLGIDQVYDLAENMGGIGYITNYKVLCAESIEIGLHLLRACANNHVDRFFFASSACVYNTDIQFGSGDLTYGLKESDAWPALPEEGYGFSKLYMEELCKYFTEEGLLDTRVARYHNIYGAPGTWNDGREKAPAAISRKVAEAVVNKTNDIEIWGDGNQLRSYLHVSDCVAGSIALMNSDYSKPMNIGSTRSISVTDLVQMIEKIAGKYHNYKYKLDAPRGVDGRNADITLAKQVLGWEPNVSLEHGMSELYHWIYTQINNVASNAHK